MERWIERRTTWLVISSIVHSDALILLDQFPKGINLLLLPGSGYTSRVELRDTNPSTPFRRSPSLRPTKNYSTRLSNHFGWNKARCLSDPPTRSQELLGPVLGPQPKVDVHQQSGVDARRTLHQSSFFQLGVLQFRPHQATHSSKRPTRNAVWGMIQAIGAHFWYQARREIPRVQLPVNKQKRRNSCNHYIHWNPC